MLGELTGKRMKYWEVSQGCKTTVNNSVRFHVRTKFSWIMFYLDVHRKGLCVLMRWFNSTTEQATLSKACHCRINLKHPQNQLLSSQIAPCVLFLNIFPSRLLKENSIPTLGPRPASTASTEAPASSSTSTTATWPFLAATCSGCSEPQRLPRANVSMSCDGVFAEVMHVEQMATSGERMNYWEIPHSCAQVPQRLGLSHRSECPELRPTSEVATYWVFLLHRVRIFAEKVPHSSNEAKLSCLPDVLTSVRLRGGQKDVAGDVAVVFRRRRKYNGIKHGVVTWC